MRLHGPALACVFLEFATCGAIRAEDEVGVALEFFQARRLFTVESLRRLLPAGIPESIRLQVLANLPPEGELRPTASESAKLEQIQPVLRAHFRESQIVVKLIDVMQAAVGLHARCVLLISRRALNLLNAFELEALAAHEVGHEYFWSEYESAVNNQDPTLARQIELRCDGVAVLTLRELNQSRASLASAIKKLDRFNRRFGATTNASRYVSESDRFRFQKGLLRLLDAHPDGEGASSPH